MPRNQDSAPAQRVTETRFLRRFAGVTRIAVVGTMLTIVPIMVMMPFVFASDGRLGWTAASALMALIVITLLLTLPLLGYQVSEDGIASRQGFPPRFTLTMKWADIEIITWTAGPIRGLTDNCTVWSSGEATPVWARWLYNAQIPAASLVEVERHDAEVGPLTPMLVTLSSLSRPNRRRLLAAFEQQGFEPVPESRSDYNSTVSLPAADRSIVRSDAP